MKLARIWVPTTTPALSDVVVSLGVGGTIEGSSSMVTGVPWSSLKVTKIRPLTAIERVAVSV